MVSNLHGFILLNGALLLGYVVMYYAIKINRRYAFLSAQHLLTLARFFLMQIIVYFCLLFYLPIAPSFNPLQRIWQPFTKLYSSVGMLTLEHKLNFPIEQFDAFAAFNSQHIIWGLIIAGCMISIGRYGMALLHLEKQLTSAFPFKQRKNVAILFHDHVQSPLCFFLGKNYIFLPLRLLEHTHELTIAIRHEFQHLRQHDALWAHLMAAVSIVFFLNPIIHYWKKLFSELQELACDEALMKQSKISSEAYVRCLLETAKYTRTSLPLFNMTINLHHSSPSFLIRRINMIFNFSTKQTRKRVIGVFYALSLVIASSTALALNSSTHLPSLDMPTLVKIIQESSIHPSFQVRPEPETLAELNQIRNHPHSRDYFRQSLQRMSSYQTTITRKLNNASLPHELLVIPLVESGYQPLPENRNPVKAAGIWQIIPPTGEKLGLKVTGNQDERLNTEKATEAALLYLTANFNQFKNWKLAILAYEYGENHLAALIQAENTDDAWTLARSKNAPANMKKFLAMVDASLLILSHPDLVDVQHANYIS